MSYLHIDDFYKDAAKILYFFYKRFPRREDLYVFDITGEDETDEFGLHSDRHLACLSTMHWLAEEGFIRYENSIKQEGIHHGVLTHRCFVLLSSPSVLPSIKQPDSSLPSSVQEIHSTTIAQLEAALKTRDSHVISSFMLSVIREI